MNIAAVLRDLAHYASDTHQLDGMTVLIEKTQASDAPDEVKAEIIGVAEKYLQIEAQRGQEMLALLQKYGQAINIDFITEGSIKKPMEGYYS